MTSPSPEDELPGNDALEEDALIESIQAILLGQERERIRALEREAQRRQQEIEHTIQALEAQIQELQVELNRSHQENRAAESRILDLQTEVEILRRKAQADSEGILARVSPVLSDMIGRSIRDSRDEMAEALGPVMGEAIRVQIRDSRAGMVEAIYPIIGETVQRAIAEFAREFQRNIDARIRSTFGPQGFWRMLWARLRGVSAAELAMRDALPFSIKQIFLIQRETGLLMSHSSTEGAADSDLISGMLTAIRDFVRDSFGGEAQNELDEVQYGDQRIVVQSGSQAYLAVVISGVEPEGFRAQLRQFVAELHVKYESALRNYRGDPGTLPVLEPHMDSLVDSLSGASGEAPRTMSRSQRSILVGGAIVLLLGILLACFYTQFTVALLPVAFPSRTPTITSTPTYTPTITFTPTLTPSHTPTFTLTPTRTPTSTLTPTPTQTLTQTPTNTPTLTPTATTSPTPSLTPTITLTPTPIKAFARGNVWVRPAPSDEAIRETILYAGTPVIVLSQYGLWVEIQWSDELGQHLGWTVVEWIVLNEPIAPELITPTATPLYYVP